MIETYLPAIVPYPTTGNITTIITDRVANEPNRTLISRPIGNGWQPVSALEFDQEIRSVAKGLIAYGVARGDRVAIMAKTRYEWTILDFAIIYCGAITVPIYETSSAEQVKWILTDSGSVLLIVESPTLAELAKQVLPPGCREILTITNDAIQTLVNAGRTIADSQVDDRINSLGPEDLLTLIYTSGTTGNPKGVTFTHANFMSECSNVVLYAHVEFLKPGGSTLLFLPIAHVFGRMIQFGVIHAGMQLAHCGDINRLPQDLETFKPTLVLAVPRVFEKVFNSAENKAHETGKSKIFAKAVDIAVQYSQGKDTGKTSARVRALHLIFDHLVYSKIRTGLGGRVDAALSGGAPLSPRLGHFFRGAGINILEGYGLTETTAASSLNVRSAQKIGSVGRPIPGTRIKIAPDGEVLIKGAVVMKGYWQNDAATHECMTEDGYFKSGDLGTIDEKGFLSIVGRKKEIIVTSGGKNVAPEILEDRLRAHPLISQCMVVGDNKPFIAALITLDPDAITVWAKNNKKVGATIAELTTDPALIDVIQTAVDDANKVVSRPESIRKFTILPVDFTIEDGQLTAKLSVKRHVVNQQFAQEIADLFD
ncbi:MAG: AMP-dependent synthetase/ligase [Actinomycetota bacterium]